MDNKKTENLYRYMPIHRLIEVFETGNLTFSNPSKWPDAFENYLSKVFFIKNSEKTNIKYLNGVFVSCWTLSTESDLFWRAYCPNKDGVRIKTSIDKIEKLIRTHIRSECFTHKRVRYISYKDFIAQLNDEELLKANFNEKDKLKLLDNLFHKRKEFTDENEYRIVFDRNIWCESDDFIEFFKVYIDPVNFIDEIRFDPAMPDELCNVYKEYFVSKRMKDPQHKIKRSLLYKYEINRVVNLDNK